MPAVFSSIADAASHLSVCCFSQSTLKKDPRLDNEISTKQSSDRATPSEESVWDYKYRFNISEDGYIERPKGCLIPIR